MSKSREQIPSDAVRTVRLVAEEMPGGWQVAVWWYGHDEEGQAYEGQHLNAVAQIPSMEIDLDQCWMVLMTAVQLVEHTDDTGTLRRSRLNTIKR